MVQKQYERFFRQIIVRILNQVFGLQVFDRYHNAVILRNRSGVKMAVLFSPKQQVLESLGIIHQDFPTDRLIGGYLWSTSQTGEIINIARTIRIEIRKWTNITSVLLVYPEVTVQEEIASYRREGEEGITDVSERQYVEANLIAWTAHEVRHMLQATEANFRSFAPFSQMSLSDGTWKSLTSQRRYKDRDFEEMKEKIVTAYRPAYQSLPNPELWFSTEIDAYRIQLLVEDLWLSHCGTFAEKLKAAISVIREPAQN